jgi:hypothetical protein
LREKIPGDRLSLTPKRLEKKQNKFLLWILTWRSASQKTSLRTNKKTISSPFFFFFFKFEKIQEEKGFAA